MLCCVQKAASQMGCGDGLIFGILTIVHIKVTVF